MQDKTYLFGVIFLIFCFLFSISAQETDSPFQLIEIKSPKVSQGNGVDTSVYPATNGFEMLILFQKKCNKIKKKGFYLRI